MDTTHIFRQVRGDDGAYRAELEVDGRIVATASMLAPIANAEESARLRRDLYRAAGLTPPR